jgi:hypothetical protein
MKKLQNFKLFESETEKLPIYDVEDYIVEVLDKYKDRILRWAIGEYLADPSIYKLVTALTNIQSLYHWLPMNQKNNLI